MFTDLLQTGRTCLMPKCHRPDVPALPYGTSIAWTQPAHFSGLSRAILIQMYADVSSSIAL